MKQLFAKQARRAGFALLAAAAFVALGITTTQAAPTEKPPKEPTFTKVTFSIETGTGGSEGAAPAGALTCSWQEVGLNPFQLVIYNCDAAVVGAVEGCVFKNKLQGNSPTQLSVFKNPLEVLGGAAEGSVSNNSGRINGSTTTPVPVSGGGHGGHLCNEPAEAQVIAVRWCNASLVDTANNLVGGTAEELYAESFPGIDVPSCAELETY